jgi:hypothetical protein
MPLYFGNPCKAAFVQLYLVPITFAGDGGGNHTQQKSVGEHSDGGIVARTHYV